LAPVLDGLPAIPPPFDRALLAALVAALLAITILPRPALPTRVALGLAIVLALGDQSRWQPWFYQYVVMLAMLALPARWREEALPAWRLILVAIYCWSGAQKLNVTFVTRIFPWLVGPLTGWLPEPLARVAALSGVVVPLAEMAIGLALLTRRLRNAAVAAAVATHLFILLAVGPFGHVTNIVIWPWNVAMIALVILLFWRQPDVGPLDIVVPRRPGAHAVVVVLFGLLPALSFVGWWDAYLSSALYSGNIKAAVVAMSDSVRNRLPPAVQRHLTRERGQVNVLDFWEWSVAELNAPSYPEDRVFRAVTRRLCQHADRPSDVLLVVFERPEAMTGARPARRSDCAALGRP
jgi:hypothetical protein